MAISSLWGVVTMSEASQCGWLHSLQTCHNRELSLHYKLHSLSCQQISFSVSDQVAPGILDTQQMLDYQTVTNLRVQVVTPFSNLGVNESYTYYAIYEWSIQGTCMCNGHGECAPVQGEELVDGKVGLCTLHTSTVCVCRSMYEGSEHITTCYNESALDQSQSLDNTFD